MEYNIRIDWVGVFTCGQVARPCPKTTLNVSAEPRTGRWRYAMNRIMLLLVLCGAVVVAGCKDKKETKGKSETADLLAKGVSSLVDKVTSAKTSAEISRVSMYGHRLYQAMITANTEREAAGLPPVWPRTKDITDDAEDIAGMTFKNSTDYFKALFDMSNYGTANWKSYVDVDQSVLRLSKKSGFCDWIVAANVKDEFEDHIPVLISANVDPATLRTSYYSESDYKFNTTPIPFGSKVGRTELPWCDDFVVVITKGGSAHVFKPKYFNHYLLYRNLSFMAPGLKYLDVK